MHSLSKDRIKEALELAGNEDKYQKWLIFFLCLLWIEINLFLVGPSYIYMNPNFRCKGFKKAKILQNDACHKLQRCTLSTVFKNQANHFTITSDLHLYCDQEFARNFTQIVFSLGAFSGLIIINLLSDIISRKFATILALAIANVAAVCAFLGGTYESICLLIVSQFLGGFGAFSLIPLSLSIMSDLCSDRLRQKGVVFVNSAWGLSTVGLGVLYILEIHWSTYLLYCMIIPFFIISVILSCYLIESPHVLIHRKKFEEAFETILQLCKFNNKEQNIDRIQQIFYSQKTIQKEIDGQPSVKKIFEIVRQKQYFRPLIILTIVSVIATLNLYGVSYTLELEGLGYGVNSIIAGIIELTSFLYLNFIIHKIPRRCGIPGFYCIVAALGMTFLIPSIKHNLMLTSLVIGVSRVASSIFVFLMVAAAYTLFACAQTESFTVEIQSIAAALIQSMSVFGILFGPLIVDFAQNINMDPIVLISIAMNFAIWPSFFLPQTINKKDFSKKQMLSPYLSKSPQKRLKIKTNDRDDNTLLD